MSVPRDVTEDTCAIIRDDSHSLASQWETNLEDCWHIVLGYKLTGLQSLAMPIAERTTVPKSTAHIF